jgi:hypothetical protein
MTDELASLTPDASRSARTLARCHDRLDRRRAALSGSRRDIVERNTLLGFGVVYLSSLAFNVLRVLIR